MRFLSFNPRREIITDSTSISQGQTNKTFFSPSGTPRILDLIVSVRNAHQQHIVIQVLSAITEDTRGIAAPVCSVYTHANRPS